MKNTVLIIMITSLLFVISFMLKTKMNSFEKKSIFECGFDPSHEKRNSFSLRFFMMTIIFLLFDLEITFIMPLPLQLKNNYMITSILTHYFIVLFFVLSTYLEWKQGALAWFWPNI